MEEEEAKPVYHPSMVSGIDDLASEFKEYADRLLIDLRLEVRSQCMYFLTVCLGKVCVDGIALTKQHSYPQVFCS